MVNRNKHLYLFLFCYVIVSVLNAAAGCVTFIVVTHERINTQLIERPVSLIMNSFFLLVKLVTSPKICKSTARPSKEFISLNRITDGCEIMSFLQYCYTDVSLLLFCTYYCPTTLNLKRLY